MISRLTDFVYFSQYDYSYSSNTIYKFTYANANNISLAQIFFETSSEMELNSANRYIRYIHMLFYLLLFKLKETTVMNDSYKYILKRDRVYLQTLKRVRMETIVAVVEIPGARNYSGVISRRTTSWRNYELAMLTYRKHHRLHCPATKNKRGTRERKRTERKKTRMSLIGRKR